MLKKLIEKDWLLRGMPLSLCKGKQELLSMLDSIGVQAFYFGTVTKAQNPRHPLQRKEKENFTSANTHYYIREKEGGTVWYTTI